MPASTCPQCQSSARPFWPAADVWRCPDCELRFRFPLPSAEETASFYQDVWKRPKESCYTGGTSNALAKVYVRRLQGVRGIPPFAGQRLLEFGAGRGAMLEAFRDAGALAQAIEPFGLEYLQQQGFDVVPSLADLARQSPPLFDGIYTVQVVEHLPKPWETLTELMRWLKPGGWLYVSTIHAGSLNARLRKAKWREVLDRTHLIFYTPRSLHRMLVEAGGARVTRLKHFIRYPDRRFWALMPDWLLQKSGLAGELCYLAWKPAAAEPDAAIG